MDIRGVLFDEDSATHSEYIVVMKLEPGVL